MVASGINCWGSVKKPTPVAFKVMCMLSVTRLFFFSSRRRHTRCSRDWSSDVCSSDLRAQIHPGVEVVREVYAVDLAGRKFFREDYKESFNGGALSKTFICTKSRGYFLEIGRASCRERV